MMHDMNDAVERNTLNQLYKYHDGNIETIKEEVSDLMRQKSYSTENIARCFTGSYFEYMERKKSNEEILNDINETISYSTQEHSVLAPNIIKGFFEGLYDLEYTYTEIEKQAESLIQKDPDSAYNIAKCFTLSYFKHSNRPKQKVAAEQVKSLMNAFPELKQDITKGFFKGLYELEYDSDEIGEQAVLLKQEKPELKDIINTIIFDSCFEHFKDENPEQHVREQAKVLMQKDPNLAPYIIADFFDSCFEHFKNKNPEQHVREQAESLIQEDPNLASNIMMGLVFCCCGHSENLEQEAREQAESLMNAFPGLKQNITKGFFKGLYELDCDPDEIGEQAVSLVQEKTELKGIISAIIFDSCFEHFKDENPEQHVRKQAESLMDSFPKSEDNIAKGFFESLYELDCDSNEIGEQAVLLKQEKPELDYIINTIIFDSCFEHFKDENPEQHVREQAKVLMQKDPNSAPYIVDDFFDSCFEHFKDENPEQHVREQAESLIQEDPNLASNIMIGLVFYCCKFVKDEKHLEPLEQNAIEQAESLIDSFPRLKQDITKGFVKGFYELGYEPEEIKEQAKTLMDSFPKSKHDITKGFFKGLYELDCDPDEIGEQAVSLVQEKTELKGIISAIIFDSCFEHFKDENPEQHVKEQAKVLIQKDPNSAPYIIASFFDSCFEHFKDENPEQHVKEQAESLIQEDPNLTSNIMMGFVFYCCKFLEDVEHMESLEQEAREQAESLIDAFPGLKHDITKGFAKGFYELGYDPEEINKQAKTLIQNIAKKDERKISEEINELFEPKKEEEKRKNCYCDSLSEISTKEDESPTQCIQPESQQNAKKSARCL